MITVITGGSGSGKSAYAEEIVTKFGDLNRIYIATMFPFDKESHGEDCPPSSHAGREKFFYHRMLYRIKKVKDSGKKLCTSGVYVKSDCQ